MAREYIEKEDLLNTGREKINRSIDKSYDAEDTSKQALKDANDLGNKAISDANKLGNESIAIAKENEKIADEANLIAKDTNERMNQIIAGTTDSAEVIDARKPFNEKPFETLGDRLDNDKLEVIEARKEEVNLNERLAKDKNELKIDLSKKNSHISSNVKMTMHFNFTDEKEVQENLDILKNLGYNTLHIQRNNEALLDVSGVATNKLLKQFKENGFNAILHVDFETLISNDYSDVENWISSIDSNENLIGYWFADEPFYRKIPVEDTELAYNRLKKMTYKDVYIIDPGIELETYTKCFDVFIWNIYPNTKKYEAFSKYQFKYAWLHDYVELFRSNRHASTKIIPMFPTFQHLEINEEAPTIEQIDTLIEFWSCVGVLSENISTFMYHFYDDGKFEDLKSSEYLRFLSNRILQNGTTSNPQKIYTIYPKQLKSSESFVSTNLEYSSTYDSLVLVNGGQHAEIILKISKNGFYNNNELYDYVTFHNNGDAKRKQLEISISYDNISYTSIHVYNFEPANLDNFPKNTSPLPFMRIDNTADSVFVRFRIFNEDGTHMTSSVGKGVGFKYLQLAFL